MAAATGTVVGGDSSAAATMTVTPAQAAAEGAARALAAPVVSSPSPPVTAADRRAASSAAAASPVAKKKAGRGVAWSDEERLCLCKGWLTTTVDPVLGTNQTNTTFWNAMVDNSRDAMIEARLPQLEKRLQRSDRVMERTFRYDISNATHRLNACRISAVKRQLTGSLTEEDLDMAAVALYNDKGPYQGIRREAAAIKCDYLHCWRLLRANPKFSIDAAMEHLTLTGYSVFGDASKDSDESDDDEVSTTPNKRRATGALERPMGTKAAKAAFRSDVSLERESAAHTAALNSLAKSSAERNDLAKRKHAVEFWSMPHVRDTPQGKAYWARQLDARLAEEGGLAAIPATSVRVGGAAHAAPLATGAASSTAASTSIAAVAAAEVAETAALAPAAVSAQSTLACAAATASGTIASSAWTPATLGAHPEHVNDSAKAVAARAATSAEPAARRRPGAHEARADVGTQRRRAPAVAAAAAKE